MASKVTIGSSLEAIVTRQVLKELGVEDPLLGIAQELEKAGDASVSRPAWNAEIGIANEVALSDSYFIDRKLYPNVDYYSGIMLRAIGIPTSMFTAACLNFIRLLGVGGFVL